MQHCTLRKKNLEGHPLQIVVDGISKEVMNNTKAMIQLQVISPSEASIEEMEPPMVYGCYSEYLAQTSFAAFQHDDVFTSDDIFTGAMNSCSVELFDTFIEARDYLINQNKTYQLISELTEPKEKLPEIKVKGLSNYVNKCFTPGYGNITVTSNPNVSQEHHIFMKRWKNK
eukprot:TRINITY_DN2541_c0_g1_i3.p1 TRINITY_DN2541_c0_g1~~TRINITY_DN2541_c0_g1_i3.p1  ORF type:complete len:171 (-),score=40.04 TRINITY_DN2541_c0_g1_i3:93-605(-)